ncbi:hypothetical protein [Rhodococcus tibetensis]|uniref:Uncharacterized protein n=1 Tax=Rhodococcus tibetensis TaxID=2965064 RepID=A0ABT1QD43_9NOCA|nr:hypothetical protein [Rhodococcus sp. FXJ9.536]MCQ4119608.1 hypothetical protein [Rhodococcus sp. FXJ9.536]
MNRPCGRCETAIDHCHGTLIVHSRRGIECTDESCVELSEVRHTLIIDCEEFGDGCFCTAEFTAELRHAS